MGCPVFDNMGVFLCNISAFALIFTGYRLLPAVHFPLPAVHCSLLIAHCQLFIRPQKNFPGAGPREYRVLQYRMHLRGPTPGKVSPGEAWRDRPLLKRRVPPQSIPEENGEGEDEQVAEPDRMQNQDQAGKFADAQEADRNAECQHEHRHGLQQG